ncbi:hypothetical protein TruAng_002253 [Truncatella angustata]|nr:hypothetical protein TruAng_002253 [Truncatella angustata]
MYYDTVSPSSLHDRLDDREHEPHYTDSSYTHHNHTAGIDPQQLLSPYSSHIRSNSASPSNNVITPAESTSAHSVIQSDFSSDFGDPFFGVNFNDIEGSTPSFLDEQTSFNSDTQSSWRPPPTSDPFHGQSDPSSPHDPVSEESNTTASHLTPDTNTGSWSSADHPAPLALAMASPRFTVSVWGKDGEQPEHTAARPFNTGSEGFHNIRGGHEDALSVETLHGSIPSASRDAQGSWIPDTATGQRGLAPDSRLSGDTISINQLATSRKSDEVKQNVASWVSDTVNQTSSFSHGPSSEEHITRPVDEYDNIPAAEIPLGHTTVNRHIPNQVYYRDELNADLVAEGHARRFNRTDLDLLPTRNWDNAPMIHHISQIDERRNQPESSQAAIEKFESMCYDNASVVSRAATWGTRRRSMPSIIDTEGVISGGLFKKLSLKASSSRRPSLIKNISNLVRRPSHNQLRKRKGSNGEAPTPDDFISNVRRESRDSLAPPSRSPSWGIRQKPMPSLNTAIVGMATGAASIGASHARTSSISASASPKTSFGLAPVKNTLRRPRSKTDIPKSESAPPNIVGMLRKSGGPPVAQLAKSQSLLDQDDDEDEDDDNYDDPDMKIEASKAEDIVPTFDGFKQHILKLNPSLANANQYLVDRIAHQMVVRFKNLQTQKIKHLKAARSRHCQSGTFCIEAGGQAVPLDTRADIRGTNPLSVRPDSSDGDLTPLEGGINVETFPAGIPMPPTGVLPAEFECQICFASRRFIKPSDWTKHVHEDVQPFTCTWDRCRDPKMFKRKADWVRHENEGHRHLEWWTCDVEECKHTCYRRDNFLQHLVREHKFTEPKVKTKAAIKKAGGTDPTWQKVERCHIETQARPQEEPCRFCGKTFPTWKKLTVHLAKHMEHISLPVLRLVSAKDLNEDTIISPVQDLPPRNFGLQTPVKTEAPVFSPQRPHAFSNPIDYSPHGALEFQATNPAQMPPQFYNQHQTVSHFDSMGQNPSGVLMMPQVTTGFAPQQYQTMPGPVTTGPSYGSSFISIQQNQLEPFPAFNNPLGLHDTNGGQLSYETMVTPAISSVDQHSNPGSVSPYSRSPYLANSGFYPS